MIRVLFVCLGNICRSPMAEAVFAHQVREAGLENQIEADSAGTGSWHVGSPAHPETLGVLEKNNVPYNGSARRIEVSDFAEFDYIVTMDEENLTNVQALQAQLSQTKAHVARLLSYASLETSEVPDPYFCGGFDGVYSLVCAGAQGLLETVRRDRGI